jgi:orotate phosphoribosyltransferase
MTHAVAVEDTITTGRNVMESISEAERVGLEVLPFVLTIVNRSGKQELPDGRKIISIVEVDDTEVWHEGNNPFTLNGQELVPPVRPKENWTALTQPY